VVFGFKQDYFVKSTLTTTLLDEEQEITVYAEPEKTVEVFLKEKRKNPDLAFDKYLDDLREAIKDTPPQTPTFEDDEQ